MQCEHYIHSGLAFSSPMHSLWQLDELRTWTLAQRKIMGYDFTVFMEIWLNTDVLNRTVGELEEHTLLSRLDRD